MPDIVAVMVIRNEAWMLAYSMRVALQCADHIVALVHASVDASLDIARAVASDSGRVTILQESRESFDEMEFRQRTLECARALGGKRIMIADADEIVSANLIPGMRQRVQMLPPGGVLVCPIHNLWRSLDRYRNDDKPYGNGWVVVAFGDHPSAEWKPDEQGYQFHHRIPRGGSWLSPLRWPLERERGGVMHLQHAVWRRVVAKHDLYRCVEAVRWSHRDRAEIVKLYSRALDEDGIRVLDVPAGWWDHDLDRSLIDLDAEPWQEGEVQRLIATYGAEAFADLHLSCLSSTRTL